MYGGFGLKAGSFEERNTTDKQSVGWSNKIQDRNEIPGSGRCEMLISQWEKKMHSL